MKPITIIGGGLAGLTLGIGLRQRGIPVAIWEAGHYPRHRVCGEFISGRGLDVLTRLGLLESLVQAGALRAQTASFHATRTRSPLRPLPSPALCLSRFTLDALLAQHFRDLGGELGEKQRWREDGCFEGLVRANGRRLQPLENGWRWFGLKVHARNVPLAADLEMHVLPGGYVGLCRLKDGAVNVCGLFRRQAAHLDTSTGARTFQSAATSEGPADSGDGVLPGGVPSLLRTGMSARQAAAVESRAPRRAPAHDPTQHWSETLRGHPGTSLRERLAAAVFDQDSFCSVAGLSLRPQRAAARGECCIGDALTMIPPVTGNGMSMAFESAGLALDPLSAYSRGEAFWTQARQSVARACDAAFSRRLAWARWLHWMMFAPAMQGALGPMVLRSGWLWQIVFSRTR
jgi:2-polyprenyl-6-methoxyphenol hydroxylase-like FAD-dependent oxidoreductase